MCKIAFIFPGQGAQYVGMAMDFLQAYPQYEQTLIDFDRQNGTDLYSIMREGPEDKLKETKFTQPAILLHSIVAMKAVQTEFAITPDFVAGHSLGEFSALVANGVLNLEDAMYLVHRRGEFMIAANEGKPFAMAAVIGPEADFVIKICEEASQEGIVIAANFNTPAQTVISGSKAGVQKACELLKQNNFNRIMPLAVGGPFHTPLMEKARILLAAEMEKIEFKETKIPIVSNVDAKATTNLQKIKKNLENQVTSPVLWVESVRNMIADGVNTFLEFGPKNVLAGMLRKIDSNVKVISINSVETLAAVKKDLEF